MHKKILKGVVFVLFLILAIYVVQLPFVREFLANTDTFLDQFGMWAPIMYILFYAVAISFMAPGTPITAAGALLFGTLGGFIYTVIGACLGAASAFWIARTLGHDFAQSLFGKTIHKYDEKMAKHGFSTILYLRLFFFPFNALNFGSGLTQIKFKDYMLGTFLGILPGTFVFVFLTDTIADSIRENGFLTMEFLVSLIGARVLVAVVMFIASLLMPKCIKYIEKKYGREDLVNV